MLFFEVLHVHFISTFYVLNPHVHQSSANGSSYAGFMGTAQVHYSQLLTRQALRERGAAVFSHSTTDLRVLELSKGYLSGQGEVLQCKRAEMFLHLFSPLNSAF